MKINSQQAFRQRFNRLIGVFCLGAVLCFALWTPVRADGGTSMLLAGNNHKGKYKPGYKYKKFNKYKQPKHKEYDYHPDKPPGPIPAPGLPSMPKPPLPLPPFPPLTHQGNQNQYG